MLLGWTYSNPITGVSEDRALEPSPIAYKMASDNPMYALEFNKVFKFEGEYWCLVVQNTGTLSFVKQINGVAAPKVVSHTMIQMMMMITGAYDD